jgi:AAA family ATP:ADP antiporter
LVSRRRRGERGKMRDTPRSRKLAAIIRTLYGDIREKELPRILFLSSLLCCIIGGFWLLDSLKDTVLATTVGLRYQPKAKLISVVVTLFVVSGYTTLVRRIRHKPTLFYLIGGAYTLIVIVIGGLLAHETIGMRNTTPDPRRLVGWFSYFAVESYGSLMVALFWAFTNASVDADTAESSYGLVVAFAQLGAVGGSALATQARRLHISFLYVLGGCSCALVCGMVALFEYYFSEEPQEEARRVASAVDEDDDEEEEPPPPVEKKAGLFDGLDLVLRHSYVFNLLMISTLYEIVLTVLDFEMKIVGRARYGADGRGAEEFARLMGQFGILVNSVSFLFSLVLFSYVVRSLGVRSTLLVFPVLCLVATLLAYGFPSLWTLFIATALLKALTYSLNEPALEMLYLPTSNDIKFKAKAWIDVVGARTAKALGSAINDAVQGNPGLRTSLPQYGNVPTFVVSLALFGVALNMGRRYDTIKASGTIVGEEDATPSGGYELVSTAPRNEGPWRRNLERLDSLDVDDDEELEDPR